MHPAAWQAPANYQLQRPAAPGFTAAVAAAGHAPPQPQPRAVNCNFSLGSQYKVHATVLEDCTPLKTPWAVVGCHHQCSRCCCPAQPCWQLAARPPLQQSFSWIRWSTIGLSQQQPTLASHCQGPAACCRSSTWLSTTWYVFPPDRQLPVLREWLGAGWVWMKWVYRSLHQQHSTSNI